MTKKVNNVSKVKEMSQNLSDEYEKVKLRTQFCIKSMKEELDDIFNIGMFDNESFISRKETIVNNWTDILNIAPTEFNIEYLIDQCNNISNAAVILTKDIKLKKYSYGLAGSILLKKSTIPTKTNNGDSSEEKTRAKSIILHNLFPSEEIIKKRK